MSDSRIQLIDRLVGDLRPVRRRRPVADAALIAVLCGVELGLFLVAGMERHDMAAAMTVPSFWWKLSSLGALAVVGGTAAILSFDPARSPRPGLRSMLIVLVLCLAAGWIVDTLTAGTGPFLARLDWRNGITCATKMVLLSMPPLVALGLLMHRGAPTDLPGTSLAVGGTAAAWGAFVFVFACPKDDPLYLMIWYAVGCGVVTVAARLSLPILNRW